jgi:hypothetical protein
MRLNSLIVILLIFSGAFCGFAISANAAPQEKVAGAQRVLQGQREITDKGPLDQEKKIILYPFFQTQRKDSKIWMERIIVTFLMSMPKDCLKYDLNSPAFRKMLYDLLQSEAPETAIQSQALASLSQQLGMNVDATVQISRSVIIVR